MAIFDSNRQGKFFDAFISVAQHSYFHSLFTFPQIFDDCVLVLSCQSLVTVPDGSPTAINLVGFAGGLADSSGPGDQCDPQLYPEVQFIARFGVCIDGSPFWAMHLAGDQEVRDVSTTFMRNTTLGAWIKP